MPLASKPDFQESTTPVRLLVGDNRIALCGALGDIQTHQHASPAVVVGLGGPLRFVAGRTHESRAALLAPGFSHAVDVEGAGGIAVFLLPPRWRQDPGHPVRDLPAPGEWVELGRALLRGELTDFEPVDRGLERAQLRAGRLDDRLQEALFELTSSLDDNLSIDELAERVRLSPTRLITLAREQVGAPLRTYRSWLRTFRVARDYAAGVSLTQAALDAGFSSSAHLSAASRQHFGIRPSQILRPNSRPAIVAVGAGTPGRRGA